MDELRANLTSEEQAERERLSREYLLLAAHARKTKTLLRQARERLERPWWRRVMDAFR